jgi:hypothetical protein
MDVPKLLLFATTHRSRQLRISVVGADVKPLCLEGLFGRCRLGWTLGACADLTSWPRRQLVRDSVFCVVEEWLIRVPERDGFGVFCPLFAPCTQLCDGRQAGGTDCNEKAAALE